KPSCGIPAGRRSGLASRLVSNSSPHNQLFKNTGRQECYSETIERKQVKRTPSGKYGENSGDFVHSGPINVRKCKSGDRALGPSPHVTASVNLRLSVLTQRAS